MNLWPYFYPPNLTHFSYPGLHPYQLLNGSFPYPLLHGAYPGFNHAKSPIHHGWGCQMSSCRSKYSNSRTDLLCQDFTVSTTSNKAKRKLEWVSDFEQNKRQMHSVPPSIYGPNDPQRCCSQLVGEWGSPVICSSYTATSSVSSMVCSSSVQSSTIQNKTNGRKNQSLPRSELPGPYHPQRSWGKLVGDWNNPMFVQHKGRIPQSYTATPSVSYTTCSSSVQSTTNKNKTNVDFIMKNQSLPRCELPGLFDPQRSCSHLVGNWSSPMCVQDTGRIPQSYTATSSVSYTTCSSTVQSITNTNKTNADFMMKNQSLPRCELPDCQMCPRWVFPGSGHCNVSTAEREACCKLSSNTEQNNNLVNGQSHKKKRSDEDMPLSSLICPSWEYASDAADKKYRPIQSKLCFKDDVPVHTQIGLLNRLTQSKKMLSECSTNFSTSSMVISTNSLSLNSSSNTGNSNMKNECKSYVLPALCRLAELGTDDFGPWRSLYESKVEVEHWKLQPRKKEGICKSREQRSKRKQTHPVKSVTSDEKNFRGVSVKLKTVLGRSLAIQAFFR